MISNHCAHKHISYGLTSVLEQRVGSSLLRQAPTAQPAGRSRLRNADVRSTGRSRQLQQQCTVCAASATAAAPLQQQHSSCLRGLYPASTPHASGYLQVSKLHKVYYEVYGNPVGVPAVVVHGGPGAGCFPNHARFFDPAHYRIILLDQRGCGRSTPTGCLQDNTTADLVHDLELLRTTLGVQQWLMLGGSWGVALSIAYAQAYPHAALGLILRGVCLMRPKEIEWMYGGGAAALKPLAWSNFVGHLPAREQGNPVLGYYKRLLSKDQGVRQAAAKSWMSWEMSVGFSHSQDLLIWDGQHWETQPAPSQQQQQVSQRPLPLPLPLPPPPQPATVAAAYAYDLEPLQRGACVPAEVYAGSSNGSVHLRSSNSTCTVPTSSTTGGPSGRKTNDSFVTSAANKNCTIERSSSRSRRGKSVSIVDSACKQPSATCSKNPAAAAAEEQPAWKWGLPSQGFNIQDPEVQQLVWTGLNHAGFNQGAAQALLECHYSLHGAFLLEQPLLDHMHRIRHVPCIAVQGQADFVCPPVTAVELGRAWPEMELRLVPGAGHSMYDPAITHELVNATDRMRNLVLQRSAASIAVQWQ